MNAGVKADIETSLNHTDIKPGLDHLSNISKIAAGLVANSSLAIDIEEVARVAIGIYDEIIESVLS